jgi:FlaA1/EpsC-like NDP-sugar epimerase
MNPLLDRLRSRTAAFSHDLLMIPVAWLAAYWLRFNLDRIPPEFVDSALNALPWVLVIQGTVFWLFGLYRGVWRFASLPDLVRIVKAAVAGTVLVVVALFILNRTELIPRSVPVLFLGLQVILLAGPRLLYRWMKDHRLNLSSGQRVLVVGAGRAGEMLVRDMLRDASRSYFPVGFVDDKPRRQGGEVHGVPVLGRTAAIPDLVVREDIDLLMLAVPSATAKEMRRLVELCEGTGRPFRTVPELRNLMTGQVSISQLRPVSIEDLLGRDPVSLDWEGIRAGLSARAVLVTGAGGSIGSELVRQIAAAVPSRLILIDNGEYNLYRIEMELLERHPNLSLHAPPGGRDGCRRAGCGLCRRAPADHLPCRGLQTRPDARGSDPCGRAQQRVGTRIVAEAAARWACERFVLISTDKAVHPANVMGATKRVAEAICQTLNHESACRYITVRFGNVLGSAGSVVPLFSRQIEHGGPLTVTHPDIERFFMTIPEACQLIMQAAVIGDGGEIFVLDMGEPVKIRYLAEQMIRLSGREPGEDISIHYIGLRPGEKLYEELFYASEDLVATRHPKIRVARGSGRVSPAAPGESVAALERASAVDDRHAMVNILRAMLPEWHPEPRHETRSIEAAQDRRNADA